MTDVMISLRRSPRKLLERDGHPGPGPGHLALIMARAGVGKTAWLVDIGMDALLAGQKVLHVSLDSTVDKVRTWYDDILGEMLKSEKKLDHWASIQLDVERRRHIHTYFSHSFTPEKLRESVALLKDVMNFEPQVLLVDDLAEDELTPENVGAIKQLAEEMGAELWMSCMVHREDPAEPGHLPPPADKLEDLVDLALRLTDQEDGKIRLHVRKDKQKMLNEALHIVLDPQTQLVNVALGG